MTGGPVNKLVVAKDIQLVVVEDTRDFMNQTLLIRAVNAENVGRQGSETV